MLIPGYVQGFDRVRAPKSRWRPGAPGAQPVGAFGTNARSSLFNLQERVAEPGGTFLPQNLAMRVPMGWATNSLSNTPPARHPGNGFSGEGVV